MTGASDEHRRNLVRVILKIGDGRKGLESFYRLGLPVIRLLYVHEGIKADQTTHKRSFAAHRQRQQRSARRESDETDAVFIDIVFAGIDARAIDGRPYILRGILQWYDESRAFKIERE